MGFNRLQTIHIPGRSVRRHFLEPRRYLITMFKYRGAEFCNADAPVTTLVSWPTTPKLSNVIWPQTRGRSIVWRIWRSSFAQPTVHSFPHWDESVLFLGSESGLSIGVRSFDRSRVFWSESGLLSRVRSFDQIQVFWSESGLLIGVRYFVWCRVVWSE